MKLNFPGDIHFVTTRTNVNKKIFKDEKVCELFLENLDFYRNQLELKIYGYCIMHDHVHLLISFDMEKHPEMTISKVMHGIKGYSAKLINEYFLSSGRQGSYALQNNDRGTGASTTPKGWRKVWQPGFYDFNIYSHKKFKEKINYIHNNPLKAGLTDDISLYKYCSWRNYELSDHSIFKIDFVNFCK